MPFQPDSFVPDQSSFVPDEPLVIPAKDDRNDRISSGFVPDEPLAPTVIPTVNKGNISSSNITNSQDKYKTGTKIVDFIYGAINDLPAALGSTPDQMDLVTGREISPAEAERKQVVNESTARGMLGVTPQHPDLQTKYPGRAFAASVAGGVTPYLVPGAALAKFTVIPAAQEIIRQSTSTEELTPAQRTFKVGTAGATGYLTGRIFQGSDILKTIAQRVGAKAVGGGVTSAINSVAQDVESGNDPDLKSAMMNGLLNASMIGVLGSVVEVPSLRGAIIQEGSRFAGKPVDLATAKKILTSQDVNLEQLSPTLKAAMSEAQKASLIKGAAQTAKNLGVSKDAVMAMLRDQGQSNRLNTIDEHIYSKIKQATGRKPVFDWRTGLDYEFDYSKMSPAAAAEIQTLLRFRKDIAAGADPTVILWNQQVAQRLNPKEYISAALKQETRNISAEHKAFIKANEPLRKVAEEKPLAHVEIAGAQESVKPVSTMGSQEAMSYMPYLQQALAQAKGNVNEQRDVPEATQLNYLQRDELLNDIKFKVLTGATEPEILNFVAGKLTPDNNDPIHEVSVLTSHQGKEDSGDTLIYDWRNLRTISISEYAHDLKQLNDKRIAVGLPAIDPARDIKVHRTMFKGQKPGVAQQVVETIRREYARARVTNVKPLESPPASAAESENIPISPDSPVSLPENTQILPMNQLENAQPTAQEFPMLVSGIEKTKEDHDKFAQMLSHARDAKAMVIPEIKNSKVVGAEAGRSTTQEAVAFGQRYLGNPFVRKILSDEKQKNSEYLMSLLDSGDQSPEAALLQTDVASRGHFLGEAILAVDGKLNLSGISETIRRAKGEQPSLLEQKEIEQKEKEAELTRNIVEGREGIEQLSKITVELKNKLGRNPTPDEIAQEAGLSTQEIRDILNIPTVADNPEMSDEFVYKDSEIPYELTRGVDILKDLYEGISATPYEQAMEDLLSQGSKKSFRKKPKDAFRAVDPFKLTRKEKDNIEQAVNLDKMSKELSQHKDFLIERYLGELNTVMHDMDETSQRILKKATSHLNANSESSDVLFAIHDINKELDAVNAEIQPANLSPEERLGGVTFNLDEPAEIQTAVGMIQLDPGEYNWQKSGDNFSMEHEGSTVEIPKSEFFRLAQEGLLDVDYTRYQQPNGEPKLNEKFKFKGKWTKDESGQVLFFPTKMIFQHTDVERDAPIMIVLDQMNQNPWMSDLRKHFKTSQTIKHEDAALRAFYKVDQDIHDKLWSTKVYEAAIKDLAQVDLHPIHDDVLKNIQDFMVMQGSKDSKKKEVYQQMLDQYSELMAEAAEQVKVMSWNPSNYSHSRLGYGPHDSQEEVDAYVQSVKKWYQFFKIPQQDQIPDAQLQASRTPVFWDLLVHPNVMHNDSLQRAILFYKAQIEMPLLEQQIKWGIYSNADIWKSINEGYTKHGWTPQGAQLGGQTGFKRGGTGAIQRPTREIRTMQEHKAQGVTEGWTPIADFFNNNFDYMVEAMKGIKQAQLHKELAGIPMASIEYSDPEFVEANAKNPSPAEFYWVQHETDSNIIAEAKRMTLLLGKKISPMKILEQGGWIKGNADDGLNKWYRGSFQPPFIYRTLYNEIRTLWRGRADFDKMGAIAKSAQKLKFTLLSVPTDTAAQYLGNVFLERPLWQIVPYMTWLPIKTFFSAIRGAAVVGPQIKAGTYKYQVGKNEHQIAWNRLFLEEGMVATGGYKSFLNNILDKESRGIFPERQDKIEDFNDYMMSVLGMNQAVMGEMVAQDVLSAGIAIAEREVARGKSFREAAKFTAHYLNTAVFMLHRDAWQGKTGTILRDITYSRNFTAVPFRVMMILSRITPLAPMLKKAGAYNFKTEGGGGKEAANVFMANEIPERFMPGIAWKFLSVFTGLFFLAFVSKMLIKESLRLMSGRSDELPDDARGAIPMYMQDVNGQELYLDFGFWKMGRDITDITSTVVDPVGQLITGNDQFDTGKGVIEWLKGKLGVIFTLQELAGLKNNDDGTPVYDRDDKDFKNAGRFAKKLMELTPINPFVGTAAPKVPYSREPLVDITLRALSALSFTIKPTADQEVKNIKATSRSEAFQQREDRQNIFTREQAEKAYRERKISKETFKNKVEEIRANQSGHDVQYWKKRDKSLLRDALIRSRRNGT